MTLVMVWLVGELWFFRPTAPALSAFVGASLLFISNFVWLGSHYRRRFRADNAIAAACYFAGHFLIVIDQTRSGSRAGKFAGRAISINATLYQAWRW